LRCGLEALALWQAIEKLGKTLGPVEASSSDPAVIAGLSRQMLQSFLDSPAGRGPGYRQWAQRGIKEVTEAHGQIFDPVSASIAGTLLIGLVLAARIKKVGKDGLEFYPGLPNLEKLIKAAAATFI